MASIDGCLSAEVHGEISNFESASSYIQKFLQKGCLPHWDVSLRSSQPSGQLYSQSNALSIPINLPLCSCPKEKYFTTEDVVTKKKSTSHLKLVMSEENEGVSHHLLHACSHSLSNAVQLVITTEPELDLDVPLSCSATNEHEFTPLAVAALSNAPLVCELLIKAGAGVNSTDALQRSPLHWAVLGNHLSTVRLLLKHGASAELVDQKGFTPLMYACILKAHDVVAVLLKEASCGADLPRNDCGTTPLMIACLQGSPEIVKLLLKQGAQLSLPNKQGLTAVHHAVWGGDIKCVKQVLSRGGRTVLTQRDRWGRTPLLVAAAKGDINMCQFLLKKGAWLADVDEGGRTVLHWAVLSQQRSCLEFLLNYSTRAGGGQALIHQRDNEGATPVHYATITTTHDILTLLQEKGAPLGQRDNSGHSPLVWAAVCGNVAAVETLLNVNDGGTPSDEQEKEEKAKQGEGVNNGGILSEEHVKGEEATQNEGVNDGGTPSEGQEKEEATQVEGVNDGDTPSEGQEKGEETTEHEGVLQPIHAAASVGSEKVCLILIQAGAKVNSMSPTGLTPLHYASSFGHTACAKLLLEHGGIVDAITPQHETGLHLACRYGHAGVANHLLQHQAKIDHTLPPLGDCPVHLTSTNGHNNVLEVLVRYGCNVDEKRGSDHQTALHLAACNGHLGCCKVLVKQGCSTTTTLPTLEKLTALDVALLNGHKDCADFLVSYHAPTGGGAYHRAACTIQAVWRFYRHKCRMATAREWCASVIQRAVRHWLGQKRAKRLREARERARHRAAATIQYHWKLFIAQKRRYESTYAKLKARLERERVAAELIVTELQYQRHSVELPTAAPMKIKSLALTNQSSPTNPRYLLRATANPVSVFPSGSVMFPAKPQRPLVRRMPNIRVATKPNSQQIHLTISTVGETSDNSLSTPPDVNISSGGDRVRLPPVLTNTSLTGSLSKTNDRIFPVGAKTENRDHSRLPSSEGVKLPALAGNGSLVAVTKHDNRDKAAAKLRSLPSHESITKLRSSPSQEAITKPRSLSSHEATVKIRSSPSHESALKSVRGKNQTAIRNSSSSDQLSLQKHPLADNSITRKSASPNPVKFQSRMKVTRYSTFKDTPLGYKPAVVCNQRDNGDDGNAEQDTRDTTIQFNDPISGVIGEHSLLTAAQTTKNSSSKEQLNITDDDCSIVSHSPHSPNLDEHLYQQAQRYDKLNQVLTLLQQAKGSKTEAEDGENSEPSTPVKISELKSHIKTALDEAVRLRADTEALQHRVITTDTGPHKTGTVNS